MIRPLLVALAVLASAPTVTLDRANVAVGDTVLIRLAGWPPGSVDAQVCGNEGLRDSADCALGSSVSGLVRQDGTALIRMPATEPPVGCPCVVRVGTPTGSVTRVAAITVRGAPGWRAPADTFTATQLTITKVSLADDVPWTALYGGAGTWTVEVAVRNSGMVPVTAPPLSVVAGRPGSPTTIITPPPLGTIPPAEERTYAIPVTLEAPVFGTYIVRGEINGMDQPVAFESEITSYPWGLPAMIPLAGLLALTIRNRKALVRSGPR